MNGKLKNIFYCIVLIFLIISCRTKEIKIEKEIELKKGLNYKIPEGMEESPSEARKYNYNNFILEKNKIYSESKIIIAIREAKNIYNYALEVFSQMDQGNLKKQVDITYLKKWNPLVLKEKKIEYTSYEFFYKYSNETIYQRSVYIKYNEIIYIISMSAKEYENLDDKNSGFFWENIIIVY